MTCTRTRIQIRLLAQNSTAMAGEIMMVAAKQGVKRTRRVLSLNLLRGLRKRRVGTHAIEKMAKNLTEVTERQEKVVIKLIDIAIDAAAEKAAIASREADKSMKEAKRALPVGWQRKRFREILREEAQDLWQERKEKNSKKKDHLEAKHKPRKESHSYRGIPISDRALGGEDAEIKVTAIGVEISEDEKEFLKLPKSATDFVGIDEEKVETSIQIMAAKLRMSLRNQEEEGEGGLEAEEQEALLATRRFEEAKSDRLAHMQKDNGAGTSRTSKRSKNPSTHRRAGRSNEKEWKEREILPKGWKIKPVHPH